MSLPLDFILESERLRLRAPASRDLPHIFTAAQYPGFTDGMLWDPPKEMDELIPSLERSIERWERGIGYNFNIDRKADESFVGRISIRQTDEESVWNVGFWTHPESQGQGIMSEALASVLDFAFGELLATSVEAEYATWNLASERVLQKNGFQFVKHIELGFQKHGTWHAENRVRILRSDWLARQKA
ncbi:MAG: GNAT family N-acetyltransferase [Bacteroidota bacterium]